MLYKDLDSKLRDLRARGFHLGTSCLAPIPYACATLEKDSIQIALAPYLDCIRDGVPLEYYTIFKYPETHGSWPIQYENSFLLDKEHPPNVSLEDWDCRVTASEFDMVLKEFFSRLDTSNWLLMHWQEGDTLLEDFVAKRNGVGFSELKAHVAKKKEDQQ